MGYNKQKAKQKADAVRKQRQHLVEDALEHLYEAAKSLGQARASLVALSSQEHANTIDKIYGELNTLRLDVRSIS